MVKYYKMKVKVGSKTATENKGRWKSFKKHEKISTEISKEIIKKWNKREMS